MLLILILHNASNFEMFIQGISRDSKVKYVTPNRERNQNMFDECEFSSKTSSKTALVMLEIPDL